MKVQLISAALRLLGVGSTIKSAVIIIMKHFQSLLMALSVCVCVWKTKKAPAANSSRKLIGDRATSPKGDEYL